MAFGFQHVGFQRPGFQGRAAGGFRATGGWLLEPIHEKPEPKPEAELVAEQPKLAPLQWRYKPKPLDPRPLFDAMTRTQRMRMQIDTESEIARLRAELEADDEDVLMLLL